MAFWKPGTIAPGSQQPAIKESQLDRENEKEVEVMVYNPFGSLSIQQQRVRLPIYQYSNHFFKNHLLFFNKKKKELHILYLVEKYPVLIIVGETGCGKTTRIFFLI